MFLSEKEMGVRNNFLDNAYKQEPCYKFTFLILGMFVLYLFLCFVGVGVGVGRGPTFHLDFSVEFSRQLAVFLANIAALSVMLHTRLLKTTAV